VARTYKDGRRGGAHRGGHEGKEYWKSRWKNWGEIPGRWTKAQTHRFERRAPVIERDLIADGVRDVRETLIPCAMGTCPE
jgi:hypothetical protein